MKEAIITGGRTYSNRSHLFKILKALRVNKIINGGCSGADELSTDFAIEHKLEFEIEKADWKKYGRSAGPKRNKKMLIEHPDAVVVAFKGGDGTENCINQALRMERLVIRVEEPEDF